MQRAGDATAAVAARYPNAHVNGRDYTLSGSPVVVICADGCGSDYVAEAIASGRAPALARMMTDGFAGEADAVMPTFTNPNNVSIVTGAPPAVHGISGNYLLDRATRAEIMMLDDRGMRGETIPGALSRAGARVGVLTAKDKLRRALSRGLTGVSGSAEEPEELYQTISGGAPFAPAPEKYSADLSLFVLDGGVQLVRGGAADLLYLSLSDYVQHGHAPDAPATLDFLAAIDARVATFLRHGCVVGIVADHGMSDMAQPDGTPRVVYLGEALDEAYGRDATRVICPITDPFGRHHASLGGFVRVYLFDESLDPAEVAGRISALSGVEEALTGREAAARFELPPEGEGDIAVLAEPGVALGIRREDHDLSQLAGVRLRSHGSRAEQRVPFLLSHPLAPEYARRARAGLRVYDIFDFAINGVRT